jgi:hypothetical protein
MDTASRYNYPNIVPCLVFPYDRVRMRQGRRDPALVFAQRGKVVLFAAESTREFGVGTLDPAGELADWDQYQTLDLAARAFLAREPYLQ